MKLKPIWMFVICCITPFVLAYGAILVDWQPRDTTNKGLLLSKEIYVPNWQSSEHKLWSIALSAPDTCTSICNQQIKRLNKVYEALGRKQDKVSLVILGGEQSTSLTQYPSIDELTAGWLYLVDHHGLIVLAYPYDESEQQSRLMHKGLLSDLKKLLNYARSS
jgi:hypothetical protein